MSKFQIGDRVECHYRAGDWDGELGTVVFTNEYGMGSIAVELDLYHGSKHTCDGWANNGHGWWYSPSELILIHDRTLPSLEDLI